MSDRPKSIDSKAVLQAAEARNTQSTSRAQHFTIGSSLQDRQKYPEFWHLRSGIFSIRDVDGIYPETGRDCGFHIFELGFDASGISA